MKQKRQNKQKEKQQSTVYNYELVVPLVIHVMS